MNRITNDQYAFILDFDGTMCRLFENYDLKKLSHLLHTEMMLLNIDYPEGEDSFEVFDAICKKTEKNSELRHKALKTADIIIRDAECEAVETGTDVKDVRSFIETLKSNSIPVGIATNNSEECIRKFLKLRGIEPDIPVSGRQPLHPELLKPDPWTLKSVMDKMKVHSENVIFIGDSLNDYQCARALSLRFTGMASTFKKMKRLKSIPDNIEIVEDYTSLVKKFPMK